MEKKAIPNLIPNFSKNDEAVILAITSCIKLFPNNNGKIYLSNISTFFKIKKNEKIIISTLGEFPTFSRDDIQLILSDFKDKNIVEMYTGARNAIYIYFNESIYQEYVRRIQENNNFKLSDEDIDKILFAVKSYVKEDNYKKVFSDDLLSYIQNNSNQKELKNIFNGEVSYSKFQLDKILDALVDLKLLYKHESNNNLDTYFTLNEYMYKQYLHSKDVLENYVPDDFAIKSVLFAVTTLSKRYPKNEGKVYISNITTLFKEERSKEELISNLGSVPTLDKFQINKTLITLENKKFLEKHVGERNAVYVILNENEYAKYLHEQEIKSNFIPNKDDIKNVLFSIIHITKQYPKNEGKVYISNILTFFRDPRNKELIEKELKCLPIYSRPQAELIVDELVKQNLVFKYEGTRNAYFVKLNPEASKVFMQESTYKPSETDLNYVIFACECLVQQYPKNEGKIYISNILIFFKDKRNEEKILNEFGLVPNYNRAKVESIVKTLENLQYLKEHEGEKGAKYVTLNKKKVLERKRAFKGDKDLLCLHMIMILNGRCAIDDLKDILFNEKSHIILPEDKEMWEKVYFPNKQCIENVTMLYEALGSCADKNFIKIERSHVFISFAGLNFYRKAIKAY